MWKNRQLNLVLELAFAQVDFSPRSASYNKNTDKFGLEGMAFIAEFGIMVPISHLPGSVKNQEEKIVGQKVVILSPESKNYSDFVSLNTPDSSFRPVGIAFNQNEGALYIASIGKVEVRTTLPNNNNIVYICQNLYLGIIQILG